MVTQFAQTEQNMNAVERVIVYAELPPEGDTATPNDPPPSWPARGAVAFRDVCLAYREGLPLVLRDVSFEIRAGEKVRRAPWRPRSVGVLTDFSRVNRSALSVGPGQVGCARVCSLSSDGGRCCRQKLAIAGVV